LITPSVLSNVYFTYSTVVFVANIQIPREIHPPVTRNRQISSQVLEE